MELRSCPWCKFVPDLTKDTDGRYDIVCVNPQCPVQPGLQRYYTVKKEAIRAWNRRADDADKR